MIQKTETDKGWRFKIDGEHNIDLSPDQILRLRRQLNEIATSADHKMRIRFKWKSIIESDFARRGKSGRRLFTVTKNGISDEWFIIWFYGRRQQKFVLTCDQFIAYLRKQDRDRACRFFTEASNGEWKPAEALP